MVGKTMHNHANSMFGTRGSDVRIISLRPAETPSIPGAWQFPDFRHYFATAMIAATIDAGATDGCD